MSTFLISKIGGRKKDVVKNTKKRVKEKGIDLTEDEIAYVGYTFLDECLDDLNEEVMTVHRTGKGTIDVCASNQETLAAMANNEATTPALIVSIDLHLEEELEGGDEEGPGEEVEEDTVEEKELETV